ncbi:hypothetical protein [Roseibacillus persicicus]|uniref:Uncharacterized protein n=2 Tax=Roseibacillus persicicus TaxID=454148 RepID=A0A918TYT7_9BACT|nr:hypothetical protein [Roseibacillus persicicus]GHC67752.1 hypothetical protein GCM10007100_39840 [Roseibacillus persicicus]
MKTFFPALACLLIWSISLNGEDLASKGKEMESLLDNVHLSYVAFEEEDEFTFLTAISLAVGKAIELDAFAGENRRRGIGRFVVDSSKDIRDCVVYPKAAEEIGIVYTGRNITLRTFVVEIAKQAKMDVYTSSAGLVFCPAGKDPKKEFDDEKLSIWSSVYKVAVEGKTKPNAE